jgi:phosphate starvation-inducible PhoH-like protein
MPIKRPSQRSPKKSEKRVSDRRLKRQAEREPAENLRRYKPSLTAKNDRQLESIKKIKNNDIVFLLGPAGTGKTFVALMQGILEYNAGNYKKIVLTRPVVEAGEHLGHLPGTYEEKIEPYMQPLLSILGNNFDKLFLEEKLANKEFEVVPLAYMRGRTLTDSYIVCDEMQNATEEQLKMITTRIGENSKIVITGDPEQTDLKYDNDIVLLSEILSETDKIDSVIFTEEDSVRHKIIKELLAGFKKFKKIRDEKREDNRFI